MVWFGAQIYDKFERKIYQNLFNLLKTSTMKKKIFTSLFTALLIISILNISDIGGPTTTTSNNIGGTTTTPQGNSGPALTSIIFNSENF